MWKYRGEDFEPTEEILREYVGFVYLVTHTGTGRKYVGKKLFRKKKRRTRNGRRRSTLVESDWREYFGSSAELAEDVREWGESYLRKEVLHLARTKGELSYLEMMEQVERDVLRDDSYYNQIINVRIHAAHLPKKRE